jgi:hypothetical protein
VGYFFRRRTYARNEFTTEKQTTDRDATAPAWRAGDARFRFGCVLNRCPDGIGVVRHWQGERVTWACFTVAERG